MFNTPSLKPVDYLVIGHLSRDITPSGPQTGGTAAFSSLTAHALGLRTGIVTVCSEDLDLRQLQGVQIARIPSKISTTFENVYTSQGRVQFCYQQAPGITWEAVPDLWRNAPIVHLGPIAEEIPIPLSSQFPNSLLGLTPQGWMRTWDEEGRVSLGDWSDAHTVLENAQVAILSVEDVQGDEKRIEDMAATIRLLVVTEGADGARVFWNGEVRHFQPPRMTEVDATGAGDIFAAAYFSRYHETRDPWEAARFATNLAAYSVTRRGLESIPTRPEIQSVLVEVL